MKDLRGFSWWRGKKKGKLRGHHAEGTLLSVISLDQELWTVGYIYNISLHTSCCLSSYPRQDLHTPCTAPGCSMGHLLRTGRKKEKKKRTASESRKEEKDLEINRKDNRLGDKHLLSLHSPFLNYILS